MTRTSQTPEHKRHLRMQRDTEWVKGLMSSAALRGHDGKLILHYEKGVVRHVTEEKRHLPPR